MKTVDYPCEHGYYGLCTQCVREERNELRARVAELEARIAELQPMAECAAIMAFCGYFSRMRGPDAVYEYRQRQDSFPVWVPGVVVNRRMDAGTPLYAGSAPVPAVQDFSLMHGGYCCECGHELCDTCAPLHPIMPAPAAQMDNPDVMARATAYARDIVTWLHRDHYADNTRFEPFDDLLGLLSQIDNMVCGWKEHPAAQAEAKVADALEHAGTRAEFHPDSEIAVLCRKAAVNMLRRHNRWRRGDDTVEAVDPALLGCAIDTVCDHIEKQANDVVLLPAEATDAMQDNMREALIDQGWDSDSAGEVDFADLWHAGVYEYQERTADMLAAKAKGG